MGKTAAPCHTPGTSSGTLPVNPHACPRAPQNLQSDRLALRKRDSHLLFTNPAEKRLIYRQGRHGLQGSQRFSPKGLSLKPSIEALTTAAFQEHQLSKGRQTRNQPREPKTGLPWGARTAPALVWPQLGSPVAFSAHRHGQAGCDPLLSVAVEPQGEGHKRDRGTQETAAHLPWVPENRELQRGQVFPGRGFQSLAGNPVRGASASSAQAAPAVLRQPTSAGWTCSPAPGPALH